MAFGAKRLGVWQGNASVIGAKPGLLFLLCKKGGSQMQNEKALESRLRRDAAKLGLIVRKSRARNVTLQNQGEYMLVEASHNVSLLGGNFEATLDEIADYLSD